MAKDIFKAMELERNGHHTAAARIYQDLGNKERPVSEKEELWKRADNCRRIHNSD